MNINLNNIEDLLPNLREKLPIQIYQQWTFGKRSGLTGIAQDALIKALDFLASDETLNVETVDLSSVDNYQCKIDDVVLCRSNLSCSREGDTLYLSCWR